MVDVDERYSHTETTAGLVFTAFSLKQEVLYCYSVMQSGVKMGGTTRGLEPEWGRHLSPAPAYRLELPLVDECGTGVAVCKRKWVNVNTLPELRTKQTLQLVSG